MKLTRKQLRKLIAESFIGAPDGTVYTPQTKKIPHPDFGLRDLDQYKIDVPVVYGQDDTKVATPRLYNFLTRNRDDIYDFHEKGPKVYEAIMDPKEDPETKMQFLSLLQSYDIITDKELEDIQLELDLLTSPDFAEYRRLGAERIEKMDANAQLATGGTIDLNAHREKIKLYKNPQYVEWAKKQIDKAVDGGFEYFKDAIEERFFLDMYDYKEKGHNLSMLDYDPDEGIYPKNFASLYIDQIGGMLGAYKGFRSTEDAAYYNTELEDYTDNKSHDMILVAIDALVDAGILEELDDGKVRMPDATYQIILNNTRGRKEDFYKERGTRSAFLDDPYVPNPNLPVVTEEMIRQMIREAIFIGDTDGTVLSPKDVDDFEYSGTVKDDMSRGYHPKLDALRDLDPKQARSLAVSLGLQDDLTPYEELAVDHIDDDLIHSPETPIEHPPLQNRKAHRIQLELTKEFKQFLNSPEGAELARTIVEKYIKSFPNRLPHPEEIDWISYLLANNSPKYAGFNLKSRIYRKLGLDADDGYIVDPQTRVMFQELNHHLLLKLRAIAIKRFDSNHIKAVKAQMGVEKFPLALTEAELKQIIMEELAERKKRKKKKTKSKKRGYLYPYVYGHHDHDYHDYGYDIDDGGFDGGGDGGGGE